MGMGGRTKEGGREARRRAAEVIYGFATRDFPSARAGRSGSRVPSTNVHGRRHSARCSPWQAHGEARMVVGMRGYSHLDKEYITCPGNNR